MLLFLVIVGTAGFVILEKMDLLDGLYMTIITLSTGGFGEVIPLHTAGRIFVIFLIFSGVVTVTFIGSANGQYIIEGELRNLLGRKKMESQIKKMNDHYIIVGYGRVGRKVAEEYRRKKVPFVIIENDDAIFDELQADGIFGVKGPATEDETLLSAGIDKAKVLVSTLPDEADNMYIALTARQMNPTLYIIAGADQPERERKLLRAGANSVVSPHILGSIRMARASLRPNVVDFMPMTSMEESGLGIEEIKITSGSRYAGKSLMESGLKAEYWITVVRIRKSGRKILINPEPTAMIDKNDILVMIGARDKLERVTSEMG
ncbi:TrkA-N domain protein [Candidatus Zixiibacteriota bacterium]|nr:TrkA-N domain protein [candidate division Zixibacteria bacterium]